MHQLLGHLSAFGKGKERFSIKDSGTSVDILRKQPPGTADKAPRSITKGTMTQTHPFLQAGMLPGSLA